MSFIKKNKEAVALAGFVLKSTKQITPSDIESNAAWAALEKEYKENVNGTWAEKAQVSLINAMIFHRKAAFVLGRDDLAEICRNDVNWVKRIGFKPANWKKFLHKASGLINVVKKVRNPKTGRDVYIYQVVLPELLELLGVNLEEQIKSAESFIQNHGIDRGNVPANLAGNAEGEKEIESDLASDEGGLAATQLDSKDFLLSLASKTIDSNSSFKPNPSSLGQIPAKADDTPSPLATAATTMLGAKPEAKGDSYPLVPLATKIQECIDGGILDEKYILKFRDFGLLLAAGKELTAKQAVVINDRYVKLKAVEKDKEIKRKVELFSEFSEHVGMEGLDYFGLIDIHNLIAAFYENGISPEEQGEQAVRKMFAELDAYGEQAGLDPAKFAKFYIMIAKLFRGRDPYDKAPPQMSSDS